MVKLLLSASLFMASFSLMASELGESALPDVVDLDAIESSSFEKQILNQITDSFGSLVTKRSDDPAVDCLIEQTRIGLEEADFLWSDLAKVNGALVEKVFGNLDRFLAFIKYFNPSENDPQMAGGAIYALNVFSLLAVDNEEESTILDQETLLSILDIIKSEPFNLQVPSGVEKIISQIKHLEISKVKRGEFKGERQIRLHTNGGPIEVDVREFLAPGQQADPVKTVLIEDEANIIFHDSSRSKKKERDKRIVSFLKKVTAVDGETKAAYAQQYTKFYLSHFQAQSAFTDPSRLVEHYLSNYAKKADEKELLSEYKKIAERVEKEFFEGAPEDPKWVEMKAYLKRIGAAESEYQFMNPRKKEFDSVMTKILGSMADDPSSPSTLLDQAIDEGKLSENVKRDVLAYTKKFQDAVKAKQEESFTFFEESDRDSAIAFVKERRYDRDVPPVYFKASGFKATLSGTAGDFSDAELDDGVILPGFTRPDGKPTHSAFVRGSGTGIIGAFVGETLPL